MRKKILLLLLPLTLLACKFLIPEAQVIQVTPTDEIIFTETIPSPPAEIPIRATSTETQAVTETATAPALSNTFTVVTLAPKDGDLKKLLAAEVEKAQALGQTPVVEFDATWCPACRAIASSLAAHNELMTDAFAGVYLIQLDVDQWGWGISKTDFDFDAIPTFFKLDSQGRPTGNVIDGNAWGENIPKNMAPPLKKFFHP